MISSKSRVLVPILSNSSRSGVPGLDLARAPGHPLMESRTSKQMCTKTKPPLTIPSWHPRNPGPRVVLSKGSEFCYWDGSLWQNTNVSAVTGMLWMSPIVTSHHNGIRALLIGFLKHRKHLKGSYPALSCVEEECVGVQALCALRKLLSLSKSPGWLSPTFEPAAVGSEWIQFPKRDQLTTRFVIIAVVCKIAFGVDFFFPVSATKPLTYCWSWFVRGTFRPARGHELSPNPQHCK